MNLVPFNICPIKISTIEIVSNTLRDVDAPSSVTDAIGGARVVPRVGTLSVADDQVGMNVRLRRNLKQRNETNLLTKLNTMIHINNNQENRILRHRNAKPILAYKIGFSGKYTSTERRRRSVS